VFWQQVLVWHWVHWDRHWPGLAVKTPLKAFLATRCFRQDLTTMMIGLAMIESLAIYALVVCLIILFANPYKDIARNWPKP